ncbi:MAG: SDR family oxidoreductase, partial [Alphaproteobacteria bacterium]|nr:SDR family oxidoreductase [Alphaproteobacteria bacterium]
AGGKGLALVVDVRDEAQVRAAVDKTVATFGGLDILVNNASAIQLTGTLDTDMKRYDLMNQVNARGTFLCSKLCLPHLLKAANPHILTLSPPLNLTPRWFGPHVAYSMAKYGMSMTVLGLADEFKGKVGVNALWPKTTIATAAIRMLAGQAGMEYSRWPTIMADAAHWILAQDAKKVSGNFFIDEDVLRGAGVADFASYAVKPGNKLAPDFFL